MSHSWRGFAESGLQVVLFYVFVIHVIIEKRLWGKGFTSNLRDIFTCKQLQL